MIDAFVDMDAQTHSATTAPRVSGLDSIRFVCAAIVVFGHIPIPIGLPQNGIFSKAFAALWGNLFNGPAAVIVFFIISGFCIHFPQVRRQAHRVSAAPYYVKRAIRLAIPSFFAIILYIVTKAEVSYPYFGVLWSIICEAIYYMLYPIILPIARKYGWTNLVIFTFVIALSAALTNVPLLIKDPNAYGALGLWTWIVGLPVWLAGCWLAENWQRFPVMSYRSILLLRGFIFATSVALRVVKFHVPPPWGTNTVWLNLFAIMIVIWIGLEANYRQNKPALLILERAGEWSFSLYLVHPAINALARNSGLQWTVGLSLTTIIASFVLSWLFFLAVERPSHKLALKIGNRWSRRIPVSARA